MEFKVKKMTKEEAQEMGIDHWTLWQDDDLSPQDWLLERPETFYILEGELFIKEGEKEYHLKPGDMAAFPQGMHCLWQLTKIPFSKKVIYSYLDLK